MNANNLRKKNKKQKDQDPVLQLRPAFKGQVCLAMKVQAQPLLFATVVTTGVSQPVVAVSTATITNFATRFGALWEEYRIVKAKFTVRLFDSTNPGLLVTWVDEKSFSAGTLAESRTKSNLRDAYNLSSVDMLHVLTWTPHDPVDQQYTAIGTAVTFAAFKGYTDGTNYGVNTLANKNAGEIFSEFTFQFRGLL